MTNLRALKDQELLNQTKELTLSERSLSSLLRRTQLSLDSNLSSSACLPTSSFVAL